MTPTLLSMSVFLGHDKRLARIVPLSCVLLWTFLFLRPTTNCSIMITVVLSSTARDVYRQFNMTSITCRVIISLNRSVAAAVEVELKTL